MSRSKQYIIGAVVLGSIVIAGIFWILTDKSERTEEESAYTLAPEFTLPDASGSMVSLGDIQSDIKIINFWASWSPYSSDELKAFNQIQKEYGTELTVIALNRDTYPQDGKDFLIREGIENNIVFVYDRNDEYYKKVSGFAVPETLFLNKGGDVVHHKHGPLTYEEIKTYVDSMKK